LDRECCDVSVVTAVYATIAKISRKDDESLWFRSECAFVDVKTHGDRAEPYKVRAEQDGENKEKVNRNWVRVLPHDYRQ
jgi:hypothetical protein